MDSHIPLTEKQARGNMQALNPQAKQPDCSRNDACTRVVLAYLGRQGIHALTIDSPLFRMAGDAAMAPFCRSTAHSRQHANRNQIIRICVCIYIYIYLHIYIYIYIYIYILFRSKFRISMWYKVWVRHQCSACHKDKSVVFT
jgi:hypothetical protein